MDGALETSFMVKMYDGRNLNSYDKVAKFKTLFTSRTYSSLRRVLSSYLIQIVGVKTVYENAV
jgi:hypothetical protein